MTSSIDPDSANDIAIIGMAGRFPGAATVDALWQNICDGVESITHFSPQELVDAGIDPDLLANPRYVRARGVLANRDQFDAPFFGFSPREADLLDPQHRVFLECAWEALEVAGQANWDATRIAVFAGTNLSAYLLTNLLPNRALVDSVGAFQTMLGNDKDHLATLTSYKLNLRGPSMAVQTACSTSLVAVHLACQSLLNRECDVALAGGVSIGALPKAGYLSEEGGISSPDGHCRAFDARANGTVNGEGAGIVVLKTLAEALEERDTILAVIKGSAVNNDGMRKVGYTAPSVVGQAEVIAEALGAADVHPDSIGYVEAHGTGTRLGDPIEIAALTRAYQTRTQRTRFCAIGSVKTNIGHLDAAAGVAGLIKTVQAIRHAQLPPTMNFDSANPLIDFDNSPFFVNTTLQEWPSASTPRRAGVSSFGMGGTNAHVILEEAPQSRPGSASRECQLVTLSAKTESALGVLTSKLEQFVETQPESVRADLAYTLNTGRQTFRHRNFMLLRTDGSGISGGQLLDRPVQHTVQDRTDRPVAFLFPGQGTQITDVGRGLYEREPTFHENVDQCAALFADRLGFDLRQLIYPGLFAGRLPSGLAVERTIVAQPALVAVEYALARQWAEWGITPSAMLGHSVGEFVALLVSGALSLADAVTLVAARARLMDGLPPGAMLAVAAPETRIHGMLGKDVSLAAVNSPVQCVVSGAIPAIAKLEERLTAGGIVSQRLRVAHAFHSLAVEPILEQWAQEVRGITVHQAEVPFVSSVTGTWMTADEIRDPSYWAAQLRGTVRFSAGVSELLRDADSSLLEVGAGETLARLARQHVDAGVDVAVVSSLPRGVGSDLDSLLGAAGRLWLAGGQINWASFYGRERRRRVPAPTYPFDPQRHWVPTQREPAAAAPVRADEVTDWFYRPGWRRTRSMGPVDGTAAVRGQHWLVFADRLGLSDSMGKRLAESGAKVSTVRPGSGYARNPDGTYTVRASELSDYTALFDAVTEAAGHPDVIVHAWTLGEDDREESGEQRLRRCRDSGLYSVWNVVRAFGGRGDRPPATLVVVTHRAQDVSGVDRLVPEKAMVLGLCRVVPQEYPDLDCRSIDVVVDEAVAQANGAAQRVDESLVDRVLQEVSSRSGDPVVAFRGPHRWVPSWEPEARAPRPFGGSFRADGTYLIIGGTGRIGSALARHLVLSVGARVVLVGRAPMSHLPPRLAWTTKVPERIALESADVADLKAMRALTDRIRTRFGRLDGVIHAAGLTGGESLTLLQQCQVADWEQHLLAKVPGLAVLDSVVRPFAPEFVLVLSSLSTVLGGIGFGAYAAANQFVDTWVQQQNQRGSTPWQSVNLDGWLGSDEQEPRAAGSRADGFAMSAAAGVDVISRIAGVPDLSQVVVSTGDLHARAERAVTAAAAVAIPPTPTAVPTGPEPADGGVAAPPQTVTERKIAHIWQQLLGVGEIGVDDDFFSLNGHSLLAIQVIARIRDSFGVEVPIRSIFDGPTVAELAKIVDSALGSDETGESPPQLGPATPAGQQVSTAAIEELLGLVEQLSDDEVQRQLADQNPRWNDE